jgi:hypothetical protein
MINRYVLGGVLAALILLGIKIQIELSKPFELSEGEEISSPVKKSKTVKKSSKSNRFPASAARGSKVDYGPGFRESNKNDNLFQNNTGERLGSESSGMAGGGSSAPYESYPETPSQNYRSSGSRSSGTNSNSNKSAGTNSTTTTGAPGRVSMPFPVARPVATTPATTIPPTTTSGGSSSSSDSLTCTSNLGTGAFSSTQSVTLSCTSGAEIKYCLSENVCCDPDSGNIYTGPINIGTNPGNFCLSFQGTKNGSSKTSDLKEITYTFNGALPDLQVAHAKIFYQTTELQGQLNITSTDFGSDNLSMGVINLMNHDPGMSGMNWSCADIVNEHTTLTASVPLIPMASTDVATIPNSSQIDVFLNNLNLGYGKNYVSSYIINNNFMDTFVSCSTTMVTLEDFEFFEANPNQAEVGTNDVREFSGGFTPIGFFEPEATVYRGPAGVGSQNVASQELKSGLFGVFY